MREFSRIKRLPPYVFNITNELKMKARRAAKQKAPSEEWILRLYVAGQSARSAAALRNLEAVFDAYRMTPS